MHVFAPLFHFHPKVAWPPFILYLTVVGASKWTKKKIVKHSQSSRKNCIMYFKLGTRNVKKKILPWYPFFISLFFSLCVMRKSISFPCDSILSRLVGRPQLMYISIIISENQLNMSMQKCIVCMWRRIRERKTENSWNAVVVAVAARFSENQIHQFSFLSLDSLFCWGLCAKKGSSWILFRFELYACSVCRVPLIIMITSTSSQRGNGYVKIAFSYSVCAIMLYTFHRIYLYMFVGFTKKSNEKYIIVWLSLLLSL